MRASRPRQRGPIECYCMMQLSVQSSPHLPKMPNAITTPQCQSLQTLPQTVVFRMWVFVHCMRAGTVVTIFSCVACSSVHSNEQKSISVLVCADVHATQLDEPQQYLHACNAQNKPPLCSCCCSLLYTATSSNLDRVCSCHEQDALPFPFFRQCYQACKDP